MYCIDYRISEHVEVLWYTENVQTNTNTTNRDTQQLLQ